MINSKRVSEIFEECSLKEEFSEKTIKVESIATQTFKQECLEKHREEILSILNELPDKFKESVGGGWSFLNACYDKHGNQWTGLQIVVLRLFLLGIAIGAVEHYLASKEEWPMLPGGMPYYIIKDR